MSDTLNCFHCDWSGSKYELLTGPNGIKCPKCKKHIPQDAEGWISITNGLPEKIGLYQIKTPYGESEAFVSNTMSGKLVWVVPNELTITHWKEN